jgi:hypothetical protein
MSYLGLKAWGNIAALGAIHGAYKGIKCKTNKSLYFSADFETRYIITNEYNADSLEGKIINTTLGSMCGAIAYGPLLPFTALHMLGFVGTDNKQN